eukprot:Hpha_TRINITY_DN15188_c1_g5::TRINITY_DN15188_c1_g5_i1::g.128510::m.128510
MADPAVAALSSGLYWKASRIVHVLKKQEKDEKKMGRSLGSTHAEILKRVKAFKNHKAEKKDVGNAGKRENVTVANKHSNTKVTALHVAALLKDSGMVKELVEGGAKWDALDEDGWSPVHWAVASVVCTVKKVDKGKKGDDEDPDEEFIKTVAESLKESADDEDDDDEIRSAFGPVRQIPGADGYPVPIQNPLLRGTTWGQVQKAKEEDPDVSIEVVTVKDAGAEVTLDVHFSSPNTKLKQVFACAFDAASNLFTFKPITVALPDSMPSFALHHKLPWTTAKYNVQTGCIDFGSRCTLEIKSTEPEPEIVQSEKTREVHGATPLHWAALHPGDGLYNVLKELEEKMAVVHDQGSLVPFMYALRTGNEWTKDLLDDIEDEEEKALASQFRHPVSARKSLACFLWLRQYESKGASSRGGAMASAEVWMNFCQKAVPILAPGSEFSHAMEDDADGGNEYIILRHTFFSACASGCIRTVETIFEKLGEEQEYQLLEFIQKDKDDKNEEEDSDSDLWSEDASEGGPKEKRQKQDPETALSLAVRYGHRSIVGCLLDHKAKIGLCQSLALAWAVKGDSGPIIGLLKEKAASQESTDLVSLPSFGSHEHSDRSKSPDASELRTALRYDLLSSGYSVKLLSQSKGWWKHQKEDPVLEGGEKEVHSFRNDRTAMVIVGDDDEGLQLQKYQGLNSTFFSLLLTKRTDTAQKRGPRVVQYEEVDEDVMYVYGGACNLLNPGVKVKRTAFQLLKDLGVNGLFFVGQQTKKGGRAAMAGLQEGFEAALILSGTPGQEANEVRKQVALNIKMNGGKVFAQKENFASEEEKKSFLVDIHSSYTFEMEDFNNWGDNRREQVQKALFGSPVLDFKDAFFGSLFPDIQPSLATKFDFGATSRSGELFLFVAARIVRNSKIMGEEFLTQGFTVAGLEVNMMDYPRLEAPLHFLILKSARDGAAEKLLHNCVTYLNMAALRIPVDTPVQLRGFDDLDGQQGTLLSLTEGGTLATDVQTEVRLGGQLGKRQVPRAAVRPASVPMVTGDLDWYELEDGWQWAVGSQKSGEKRGWFGEGKFGVEEHILRCFGGEQRRMLTPAELVCALHTMKNSSEILYRMIGHGRGLAHTSIQQGRDSKGVPFEADVISDLWAITPKPGSQGEEVRTPVLHSVLRCLKMYWDGHTGKKKKGDVEAKDDEPEPSPFPPSDESNDDEDEDDDADDEFKKMDKEFSQEWYPRKARKWARGHLYGACYVPTSQGSVKLDDDANRLYEIALMLLKSSGAVDRVLTTGGSRQALVQLDQPGSENGEKKLWITRAGEEQKWVTAVVDRAGLYVSSSEVPDDPTEEDKKPPSTLGLGLLFQVADAKLLHFLKMSGVLEIKNCGFDNKALGEFLTCGGAVQLQHRHLWNVTQGGHEARAFDRRLGLSHWASLRGDLGLLETVLSEDIGGEEAFITRERLSEDFVACGSTLWCQVSELGYSPLHFAVYSGASVCAEHLVSYIENDGAYTQEELRSFINLPAMPKVTIETAPLVLHSGDLNHISDMMHTRKSSKKGEALQILNVLDECKRVNTDGDTALHIAVSFCHVRCVTLLIEKGADVTRKNTIEGVDPHDIALVLQHHQSLQQLATLNDDDDGEDREEEEDEVMDQLLETFDRFDDSHDKVFGKLKAHAKSFWLKGPAAMYFIFNIALFLMVLLYLRGGGFYGGNALVDSLGEWDKGAYEVAFDAIGNLEELADFAAENGGIQGIFDGAGTGQSPIFGVYTLVGAMRIAVLRTSEGTCEPRTQRRGDCHGGWSWDNNNDTTHAAAQWLDWSGERSTFTDAFYTQPATFNQFPTSSGLVLDMPAWGSGSDTVRADVVNRIKNGMFDTATRFVAIYAAYYNANNGHMYSVEFYFESPREGALYSDARIVPFRLRQYTAVEDYVRLGAEVIVVLFMCYYAFEEFIDVLQANAKARATEEDEVEPPEVPWLKSFWDEGTSWGAGDDLTPIEIMGAGALRMVLRQERNAIESQDSDMVPSLEVIDKDAENSMEDWTCPRWGYGLLEGLPKLLQEWGMKDETTEHVVRQRVQKLWYEIERVYELQGGDASGEVACAEKPACRKTTSCLKTAVRTVKFHFFSDGEKSDYWNIVDSVILIILWCAFAVRIIMFIQVSDKPNLYDMLDNTNNKMGYTYHDFQALGVAERRLRYLYAATLGFSGMKFLKYSMLLPTIGPNLRAIGGAVVSVETWVFIAIWLTTIMICLFLTHTAFSSSHSLEDYRGLGESFFTIYRLALGDWDFEGFVGADPALGPAVFFLLVVLMPLILLNILIAVIGSAYSDLLESADDDWRIDAANDYIQHSDRLQLVDVDEARFALPRCLSFAVSRRMNFASLVGRWRLGRGKEVKKGFRYTAVSPVSIESLKQQKLRDAVSNGDVMENIMRVKEKAVASGAWH